MGKTERIIQEAKINSVPVDVKNPTRKQEVIVFDALRMEENWQTQRFPGIDEKAL